MTLDHVGPMADTVENAARLLTVMAGEDPLDPRQRGGVPPAALCDYTAGLGQSIKGMRIAVVQEGFGQTAETWGALGLPESDPVVDRKVKAAVHQLARRGAVVSEVSVPMHVTGLHIWHAVLAEGATEFMLKGNGVGTNWLGFYDRHYLDFYSRAWRSRPNDLPHGVKITLLLGEYMNRHYHGRYYAKAQNLRHHLRAAYDAVLAEHEVMVMPTTVTRAQPIPDPDCSVADWIAAALGTIHNCAQTNLTGHPAHRPPFRRRHRAPGRRRLRAGRRLARDVGVGAIPGHARARLLRCWDRDSHTSPHTLSSCQGQAHGCPVARTGAAAPPSSCQGLALGLALA